MITTLLLMAAIQSRGAELPLEQFQSELGRARGLFGPAPMDPIYADPEDDPYYYKIEMFSSAVFIFPAGVSERRYLYRPGRSLALMEKVGGKLRKVWHADVSLQKSESRIIGKGTLAKFIGSDGFALKKGKFSEAIQKSLDSTQAFALYNYIGSATNRGVFIKPDGTISMDFADAPCRDFWAGDPYPVSPEEWQWVRSQRHFRGR